MPLITDIVKSGPCAALFSELSAFAEESLRGYTSDLSESFSESPALSRKDIYDMVWGSAEFSPFELCVLDSPLLQRLRRVRQLGMVCAVYCNADFSRFAHTVGVVRAAHKMAAVVERKLREKKRFLSFDFVSAVRLAAIFHDTGHMFFSHVSESFFTKNVNFPRYDEISAALAYFNRETGAYSSLHEVFSVMLASSEAVRRLLRLAAENTPFSEHRPNPEDLDSFLNRLTEYICAFIIGVPVDAEILPFSRLLNGALDADKLDYLFRDSKCTNIPISVDIERLIHKLEVVKAAAFSPAPVWQGAEGEPLYLTAVKFSAQKVLLQLSLARAVMYESVYLHHKALTLEKMAALGCADFFRQVSAKYLRFDGIMRLTDDSFGETALAALAGEDTAAFKIFADIRNRKLYKRLALFSAETVKTGFAEFSANIVKADFSAEQAAFFAAAGAEYAALTSSPPPSFAFIRSSTYANEYTSFDIPIEYGDGAYKPAAEVLRNPAMATEGFYLITDAPKRDYACAALLRVLSRLYGIELTDDAPACSKCPKNRIDELLTPLR
ncbi:MAG: HD domain-containing protein [Clostridiales bacterium]|jgi:HD superfamily phosphohydrolase|nr:HD domain-containing protein [Clostridiales bacterium]